MGNTALWTAAHSGIPCLFVVCNNRSFHTDERHQAHVMLQRGRSVDTRGVGARIEDLEVDLVAMARSLGAVGLGPVDDAAGLAAALEEAVAGNVFGSPLCDRRARRPRDSGEGPSVPPVALHTAGAARGPLPASLRRQWPRRSHSSRSGASWPIVVLSPWPVCTIVSGGSVSSRARIDSTIVGKSLKLRPVAPGPPQNNVSPLNT